MKAETADLYLSDDPSREELADLLRGDGPDPDLFSAAHERLLGEMGGQVYLRGLVEISNRCRKNCLYCGLRRDRSDIERYSMQPDEVMEALATGYGLGLRSFLLQSGEMLGEDHVRRVAGILRRCSEELPGARMVLSLGELPEESFDILRDAGGHRYLLRIESSSPSVYRRFHPDDGMHSHSERLRAIEYLKKSGWQTGTGVLIGLTGQSAEDLADDLLFIRDMDVDMIGMGPYVESPGTPMSGNDPGPVPPGQRVLLTLRMISIARLMNRGVNIAATTALQTLSARGLERGLLAGANVVMPNLTPAVYRASYDLYQGKVTLSDDPEEIIRSLSLRCGVIGREIVLEDPGDPPHYAARIEREEPAR